MDDHLLLSTLVGGMALLWSYYAVFAQEQQGYLDSRFWVGIPKPLIRVIVAVQLVSLVGFLIAFFAPSGLITGRKVPNAAHLTCLFFAGSVAWAFLARSALEGGGSVSGLLTVVSLIVAAVANVMLLLASIKARNHTASVGLLLLALTVVLSDGILWNIMFARAVK